MKERLKAWGDSKVIPIVGVFAFSPDGELLLLQRHSLDLGGGQWGTPGGRIDPGETALAAMRRELQEETGLTGVKFKLLGYHEIHMPHGTVHMASYQATIPKDSKITLDPDEHHAYGWFKPKNLLHADNILWGVPSILKDFSLIDEFSTDPTLTDGSFVKLLAKD
jgi:8-oxo-dGTP pyrophosphatase MutT (NUDIX family)